MADMQSQIIISQQKQIRKLEADVHQLAQDNDYLKRVLYIALRDVMQGTPLVISNERLSEAATEFCLDTNLGGDQLIWAKRSKPC